MDIEHIHGQNFMDIGHIHGQNFLDKLYNIQYVQEVLTPFV